MITPDRQLPPVLPQHVAIIMDGNGRWARQRGLPRIEGHKEGAQSVRAVLKACHQAGIRYLTLYAFSTENWNRPHEEVKGLMKLLTRSLNTYETELHKYKIRLRIMGEIERLPQMVRRKLKQVIKNTADYPDYTLIIALSYGARREIAQAAKQIALKVKTGELKVESINEQTVADHLYLPDVPDPELMIRTSGEMRLSNFLLWQLSYTELYITETLWPDFREEEFFQALEVFSRRHRRFGRIEEQSTNG